jgi:hypothetical protein
VRQSLRRLIVSGFLVVGARLCLFAAAGDPIQNNNYRLDLTRTVATGSTRKIAMGGAFVGLAEGNAAIQDNPAAVAYRPRAFMRPWEFDMALGTLTTTDDDTDNSGSTSLVYSDHVLADVGLMGQYKHFGLGFLAKMSAYKSNDLPQDQVAQLVSGNISTGYECMDHQLALGFSLTPIGARAHPEGSHDARSFGLKGFGYAGGIIYHPERGHWRFGAAYTSAVSTDQELVQTGTSPVKVGNLIVPGGVLVAGSTALGGAYEWDQFPFWKRHPAIATFDMRIFNVSPPDAQSVKSFLTQTAQPVGQKTIVTLHTGLEAEAVPKFLRLRVGTYREPSRYDGISARQHITCGFEARVTKFNVWDHRPLSISYAFDAAKRYQVHSFSVWLYTFTVPVAYKPSAEFEKRSP